MKYLNIDLNNNRYTISHKQGYAIACSKDENILEEIKNILLKMGEKNWKFLCKKNASWKLIQDANNCDVYKSQLHVANQHVTHLLSMLETNIQKEKALSNYKNGAIQNMRFGTTINKRFVVMADSEEEVFDLFFFTNSDYCDNSHSALETLYKKEINKNYHAVGGGFYINNTHNHSMNELQLHLFGESDSFGSFYPFEKGIQKWAEENNIIVTLSKEFKNSYRKANIIFTSTVTKTEEDRSELPF